MKYFRKIYDVFTFLIILIGVISLIKGEYYLAVVWIIFTPLVMLLPRNLYKINSIKLNYKLEIVDFYEMCVLILLITSAGLTLGLKHINIDFDSFSHFLNLLIYTLLFGITYYLIRSGNNSAGNLEVALISLAVVWVFGVFLWEKFQYLNDQIFGTRMFFDEFQAIELDSFLDQIFGSIGVIIGSVLIYFKIEHFIKIWKR